MLSILIPTYNYNVYPLVLELHKQCMECNLEFEIICQDDASTEFLAKNNEINTLENCQYSISETNSGRTFTRKKLAEKAQYKWLLFLDADVIPVHSNFINNYIISINDKNQVILGGYCYQDSPPTSEMIFRYIYGKKREEKTAIERNLNPYQFIFSGNILIQKEIFTETNFNDEGNYYGMDIYFSYQLFIKKTKIIHIENPIYHLGLENNEVYFQKSLKAVENRKQFLINCPKIEKISPLIKKYKAINRFHLLPITIFFFKTFEPFLKRRILNKNPSLFCFDIYRLGYLCTIQNK